MEASQLQHIQLSAYTTESGVSQAIELSYQLFGRPLHSAPVVLVNHALTGNSNVAGPDGWWTSLVGPGKCIDTDTFTVLCFNVPGNGYDGFLIENYKDFIAGDIARIFLMGLEYLQIHELFALIGGSLGGGIAWEMAALRPDLARHLIPVASDWKSTDWLIANCQIQEQFLVNSSQPVHDARMHAMLCYRTPESFKQRFQRSTDQASRLFNVESWLLHHGKKLQERFQLAAYKLTNQLLKTIDITRRGEEAFRQLQQSGTHIHIIGVDSDLFFTAAENKETYKQLAQVNTNVTYGEIHSVHGHDAFLIEFGQMEELLRDVFGGNRAKPLKVLKFGGKSLANGEGISRVLDIISGRYAGGERLAVVLSAREKATDQLEALLQLASDGKDYKEAFDRFEKYQRHTFSNVSLGDSFDALARLLEGVRLLGDYSPKIRDQVLAFGELISARLVTKLLIGRGVKAELVDARDLIRTDSGFGNAQVLDEVSRENTIRYFSALPADTVAVVTGFIASNALGETTTLGRNGSNYTASLLANYLNAGELQNYTHVNGIFTANPELVPEAQRIAQLSYAEANELANFGATILHAKTIIPLLEKNIPLRILNTFDNDGEGTLISASSSREGIRSLSVIEHEALIHLEGRGLLGKVGVDARIFRALGQSGISVGIISQGSSERGIGLVVKAEAAQRARLALEAEFEEDFRRQDITRIHITSDVSVISIVGQDLSTFHKPYNALIRNQVVPLLFNNTVTGKNVSLVVRKADMLKALNVIHGQIFGISKKINLAIFGIGTVGSTLMDQLLDSAAKIEARKGIHLNIFAVANSRRLLLDRTGISDDWKSRMDEADDGYELSALFDYARAHHLENLIAVDNTASEAFVARYFDFVENGFDLVSSNKIANTLGYNYYRLLREELAEYQKQYLYETNVGAGLPLIDTIALLHLSGENITRIRGVFSGSLSYIFNTFSRGETAFSQCVRDAVQKGFTEPDPREDLSGNDVGRKLLILARELDLQNEFGDIAIENLIPEEMRGVSRENFLGSLGDLDARFNAIRDKQQPGHVLRYVGELSGDLQQDKGILEVKLVSVPGDSPLGQVRDADSLIEIYTESYGKRPLVIQGAGAGAAVTARGVFGDILRIAEKGYAV
ncbi:bifunctional aspartate kinase/homoserine dehydrogenase I [Robiginitalea sp. SC105]|uniref:bifunctional aspartate kinase/homoserine dehydrogenase I n=1 Tax=Robiginitalea sp. SC105 TaxID=2762332 RepID=UPI00163B0DE9|nr:bifunctional aspartate kinase/homoserine dehydrogenase I [Robiginitalea sp. SC105]MBC2838928.1 bifunctional aspartate kinase/homoserine dehydrogenase I [Robiginitalea sp. SC105]